MSIKLSDIDHELSFVPGFPAQGRLQLWFRGASPRVVAKTGGNMCFAERSSVKTDSVPAAEVESP